MPRLQVTWLIAVTVAAVPQVSLAELHEHVPLDRRMFSTPADYVGGSREALLTSLGDGQLELLDYRAHDWAAAVYEPSSASEPGTTLYVHLVDSDEGSFPVEWMPVLEEHQVVLASPHKLMDQPELTMVGVILDTIASFQSRYDIETQRVVLGGARDAGWIAVHVGVYYPELMVGVVSHGRQGSWNSWTGFHASSRGHLDYIDTPEYTTPLELGPRFAFIVGENSISIFGNGPGSQYEGMLRNLESWWFRSIRTRLFDVPQMGYEPANAQAFEAALNWVVTCEDSGAFPPRFDSDHAPPYTPVPTPRTAAPPSCDPVADAGTDQTVALSQPVVLAGTFDRFDGEQHTLGYSWAQTAGPPAALSDNDTPAVRFVPTETGEYRFSFAVTDGHNESEDEVVVAVKREGGGCSIRPDRQVGSVGLVLLALLGLRLPRLRRRFRKTRYSTALAGWFGLASFAISSQAGAERIQEYRLTERMYADAKAFYADGWRPDIIERFGGAELLGSANYEPEDISADLYIPESYYDDPRGWGVYVHLNSAQRGFPPKKYQDVVEKHRLLYISPHEAGNETYTFRRMAIAVDCLATLQKEYGVEPPRSIVGGASGGGAAATNTAANFPEYFVGSISHARGMAWESYWSPSQRLRYSGELAYLDRPEITDALASTRFAFIVGNRDQLTVWRDDDTYYRVSTYEATLKSVEGWWWRQLRMRMFDVPDLPHVSAPAEVLDAAIDWVLTCHDDGSYSPRFGEDTAPPFTPVGPPRAKPVGACANKSPTADAGKAQAVAQGDAVLLSARESSDVDGAPEPLSFRWRQLVGPEVQLMGAASVAPWFRADHAGHYAFEVTVGDGEAEATATTTVDVASASAADSCAIAGVGLRTSAGLWFGIAIVLGMVIGRRQRRDAVLPPNSDLLCDGHD